MEWTQWDSISPSFLEKHAMSCSLKIACERTHATACAAMCGDAINRVYEVVRGHAISLHVAPSNPTASCFTSHEDVIVTRASRPARPLHLTMSIPRDDDGEACVQDMRSCESQPNQTLNQSRALTKRSKPTRSHNPKLTLSRGPTVHPCLTNSHPRAC